MPAQPIHETLLYEMSPVVIEIEAIKDITLGEYEKCLTLWYYDWICKREHYDMHELHDYLKKNGNILCASNNVKISIEYKNKNKFRPVQFKITRKDTTNQKQPVKKNNPRTVINPRANMNYQKRRQEPIQTNVDPEDLF